MSSREALGQKILLAAFEDELEKLAGLPRSLKDKLVKTTTGELVPDFGAATTAYGFQKLRHHTTGRARAAGIARARKKGGARGKLEARIRQIAAKRGAGDKTTEMSVSGGRLP